MPTLTRRAALGTGAAAGAALGLPGILRAQPAAVRIGMVHPVTGALAEGGHSFTATATDGSGNTSAASAARTATVDTAPDAGVAVDLIDASAAGPGASVTFDLTGLDAGSTATVTFTGSGGGSVGRSAGCSTRRSPAARTMRRTVAIRTLGSGSPLLLPST